MKKYYLVVYDGGTEYFDYDSHYLKYDKHYLAVFHDAGTVYEDDDDLVLLVPYTHLGSVLVGNFRRGDEL